MEEELTTLKDAKEIAFQAFANSLDKFKVSPYSQHAAEKFDLVFNGGKPDDIAVVCVRMV